MEGNQNYLEKNQEVILKNPHSWNSAIGAFLQDPTKCTMGAIWIAAIRSQEKEDSPVEGTIATTERLIMLGNYKQMFGFKATLKRWRMLLHAYATLCRQMGAHRRGIWWLRLAHTKFSPNECYLTPAAPDVIMLALKGNNVQVATALLDKPILEVDPTATGVDATDYMAYYYYGGIAYTVKKDWKAAKRCLESALRVPGHASSQIMVEAYKVYLLVGLISEGRALPVPQNTPYSVERSLKQMCSEYWEYAQACENGDLQKMQAVIDENQKQFRNDHLKGLLAQCRNSVVQNSIAKLTKVYVTLSIAQMAKNVNVSEAEVQAILVGMIEDGSLNATISRQGGMVSFHDEASSTIEEAEVRVTRLRELAQRIEDLDENVSLSQPYLLDKLRANPNYRQIMSDFEAKRKAARGVTGMVSDFLRGPGH